MSAARSQSVTLYVRGLQIDAQGGEGGIVNFVVRADQQNKGVWWRLRQHLANALFRAGDACHPGDHHGALRVVAQVVRAAALDDGLANGADRHVRQVWPLHSANGDAHYIAALVHEGVKRHYDGRLARGNGGFFGQEKGADDAHKYPITLKTATVSRDTGGAA